MLIYNNQLLQASFTASSVMPGEVVVTGIKAVNILHSREAGYKLMVPAEPVVPTITFPPPLRPLSPFSIEGSLSI